MARNRHNGSDLQTGDSGRAVSLRAEWIIAERILAEPILPVGVRFVP